MLTPYSHPAPPAPRTSYPAPAPAAPPPRVPAPAPRTSAPSTFSSPNRFLASAPQRPPNHKEEGNSPADQRSCEQPQRSIENRLGLHPRLYEQRHAAQPVVET